MLELKRTNSKNQDFINLVEKLDAYLKITDGDDHDFYNQFNGIENLKNTIVAYKNGQPAGCGAFKQYDDRSVEIKRMYVEPTHRGTGLASEILTSLEIWAKELNYTRCVLETGDRQVEAVKFYHKSGYHRILNYGQYAQMENSNCFEKILL